MACLILLNACNSTRNINTFIPEITDTEIAAVYIYRPPVLANVMYSPDLFINDEFKLSVKNGRNNRLAMLPGKYKFNIDSEQNYDGNTTISLNLAAGKTYYIRVNTSLKIISASNYEPYQRSFNLTAVENTSAIDEISKCCYANEKEKDIKTETTSDTPEKAGFSVDKTQNPFSH